jgi:hypothetical protein
MPRKRNTKAKRIKEGKKERGWQTKGKKRI